MRWRSLLALLCAMLMLAEGCLAFSDTADALDAAGSLTLQVGGLNVLQLTGNEHGRETLNAFLNPLSAEISLREETARLKLSASGREVASLGLDAEAYPDVGTLPHEAFRRLFSETLPELFDEMLGMVPEEEIPEPELKKVRIRNLPTSTRRTTLTVTPEQFRTSRAVEGLKAQAAVISAHLPFHDELIAWMGKMTAAGSLTFRRLENDEGEPVAWSISGRVSDGGKDVRNLSLYGGVSGLNVYFTLKLPARSGKNNLELTVNLKDQAGKKTSTWSGTVTCKRSKDRVSYTVKDTLSLKNEHAAQEQISGSIKREVTEGGIKSVWTLTPALTGDGRRLEGTVKVTKKHAQTQAWQAELAVSMSEGAETEEAAAGDAAQFALQLTSYLTEYRNSLSKADQRQLDHMLRTDAWLNGPVVPVFSQGSAE